MVTPLYALDLIIPVLDLGQESACRLETRGVVGGWVQALRVAYQVLGAILSSLSLMKCNVILEASRAKAREGEISKWHGATLLNGGYIHFAPNVSYRKSADISLDLPVS